MTAPVTIIGDSFVKRLSRHRQATRILRERRDLSKISFMFRFHDERSVQSIQRILTADPRSFPTSALLIFHVGGNDLMNTDTPPRQLARLFVNAINMILMSSGSLFATIFPILYRKGVPAFSHYSSRFCDYITDENVEQYEKDYKHAVDEFNNEIRLLTRPDKNLRFGKLSGISTNIDAHLDPDGVHLAESSMIHYAKALRHEVRIGTTRWRETRLS